MHQPLHHDLAQKIISGYREQGRKIVTAESCTGGLVAGMLTEISGASGVFERGFITYSNDSKIDVLGVDNLAIQQCGAVSAEVAAQMAKGALEFSSADTALSVTGIAGPSGGSVDKPVGLVYFGLATRAGALLHYKCNFTGTRSEIREKAVGEAFRLLLSAIEDLAL